MSNTATDFSCSDNTYNLKNPPTGDKTLDGAAAYDTLKDSMGRFRTLSLFYENRNDKYPAPFTLKDYNHKGALSMYLKYMEIADPTEYRTAIGLLGSWRHWQVLTNCDWFKEYIERWRAELKTKLESERYTEMQDILINQPGSPQAVQATKWLSARYGETPKPKRGRPSKDELKNKLRDDADALKELAEDAERLGL